MRPLLPLTLLLAASFGGCLDLFSDDAEPFDRPLSSLPFDVPNQAGPVDADDIEWPDLSGGELRVLSHGFFAGFDSAAARFEELTGATVVEVPITGAGNALQEAIRNAGDPQQDVFYGIDNALLAKAVTAEVFRPYQPVMADKIADDLVFFGNTWYATPSDHGYVALNVDGDHELLDAASDAGCASATAYREDGESSGFAPNGSFAAVDDLADVRALSCLLAVNDPHTDTPGLGFMLLTIDYFGEVGSNNPYDWLDYWEELLLGPDARKCSGDEVLITADWGEAYENHFPAGYGNADWNDAYVGGRPIVASYTESPAVEAYFGANRSALADVLLEQDQATAFHQIQLTGILQGTPNLALAQAWIEFTLTTDFQDLAASENGVYPVVTGVDDDTFYDHVDPEPGTFQAVDMDWQRMGDNLDGWLDAWNELHEAYGCTVLG